jgi:hypothetical protein
MSEIIYLDSPSTRRALITLDEYRVRAGYDPTDTRDDEQIKVLIKAASAAVVSFTERDFGVDSVTEERTYPYDGDGFLDIDDASLVTDVKLVVPHADDYLLSTDDWTAAPARRDDSPVYYYIVLPRYAGGLGFSPAMGFTRNLDVLAAEGRLGYPTSVSMKVTATWGWPDVPDDVKLAVVWTIQDWMSRSDQGSEALTAEAIADFSRSWGGRSGGTQMPALAIPNRARDILSAYQRIFA